MVKATGKFLHLQPQAAEQKSAAGILLTTTKESPHRTAVVLSVGEDVELNPVPAPGDVVMYHVPVPLTELSDKSIFVLDDLVFAIIS